MDLLYFSYLFYFLGSLSEGPLLVAAPVAVVGPHVGPGLAAVRTVPGQAGVAGGGGRRGGRQGLPGTYWMSRHLPEFLFTMVEPTWGYTPHHGQDVGDGDYRDV